MATRMVWHGRHGLSDMNSKDGTTDMDGLDGTCPRAREEEPGGPPCNIHVIDGMVLVNDDAGGWACQVWVLQSSF